jgi:hypothetical protein
MDNSMNASVAETEEGKSDDMNPLTHDKTLIANADVKRDPDNASAACDEMLTCDKR